jgi:hypothetical protein
MSSKSGTKKVSQRHPTPSSVCVICRRAFSPDGDVIDGHGVRAHVGCAAYRRRRQIRHQRRIWRRGDLRLTARAHRATLGACPTT